MLEASCCARSRFGNLVMAEAQIIQLKVARSSKRKTGNLLIVAIKKTAEAALPIGPLQLKGAIFTCIHKIVLPLVALGIACCIVLWSKLPAINALPTAQTILIQEMHALVRPEELPVQQFEDQTPIYPAPAQQPK
jgi:hypothetical protein